MYKSRTMLLLQGFLGPLVELQNQIWFHLFIVVEKSPLALALCSCSVTALQVWVFPQVLCREGLRLGTGVRDGMGWAGLDKREQVLACNPHVLACSSLRAVKLGYALQSKLLLLRKQRQLCPSLQTEDHLSPSAPRACLGLWD